MNDKFMFMAQSSNIEYRHSITTNGYLLSQEIIEYLKTTPLSLLTITLDGPSETHDICRPLKSGAPTFWTIFRNIKEAVTAGIKIALRVNVTTCNMNQIHTLYDILESHGLKNKVEVNLQPVVSSSANPCQEYCLSGADLAQGNLYCCGQMFESDAVGKIADDGLIELDPQKNDRWVKKNPLEFPECHECALLPICMGGCNMKRFLGNGTDYCLDWRHDLRGFLEVLVLNEENIRLTQGDSN